MLKLNLIQQMCDIWSVLYNVHTQRTLALFINVKDTPHLQLQKQNLFFLNHEMFFFELIASYSIKTAQLNVNFLKKIWSF